jgi:hypothetical protein
VSRKKDGEDTKAVEVQMEGDDDDGSNGESRRRNRTCITLGNIAVRSQEANASLHLDEDRKKSGQAGADRLLSVIFLL